jgi:hypothetical protein
MKKSLIITISLLFIAAGSSESGISPGPNPPEVTSDNLLSWILPDESQRKYHTPESSIEEFHRLVGECITSEGKIKEGTEELSIGLIDWFIPVLLAEHYQLRGRGPDVVTKKFGRPVRILHVRKNAASETFFLFVEVSSVWICGSTEDGRPIGGGYWAPVECYEYHQYLVWITTRDADAKIVDRVIAVSPRSPLFDRYIAEKDLFE